MAQIRRNGRVVVPIAIGSGGLEIEHRRNGRVVECGGLENRCSVSTEPGVRIPLSPPNSSDHLPSASWLMGFLFYENTEPGSPE